MASARFKRCKLISCATSTGVKNTVPMRGRKDTVHTGVGLPWPIQCDDHVDNLGEGVEKFGILTLEVWPLCARALPPARPSIVPVAVHKRDGPRGKYVKRKLVLVWYTTLT